MFAAALVASLSWSGVSDADTESVPIGLQVQLLAKVASYDRNFSERAGARVHLAVVTKPGNAESERATAQLVAMLRQTPSIGGLPHDDVVVTFTSADALAASTRSEHFAIVYFTPGFQDDLVALRAAFQGVSVLTVATVAAYVPAAGVVLGFDTASAKPKLLFHLTQARLQNVAMSTEVVRLMTVFE
ncbi:MAG: hypothetical protein QOI41_5301 [Myxococcales bacterium]|nr:hypothetical protein [Myxococcales bacterium]